MSRHPSGYLFLPMMEFSWFVGVKGTSAARSSLELSSACQGHKATRAARRG